jgi:predicted nucleotidyltransferase
MSFPTEEMDELHRELTTSLRSNPHVIAVRLGGSLAENKGDRWSDLDLFARIESGFETMCWEGREDDLNRCREVIAMADINDLAPGSTVAFYAPHLRAHVTYEGFRAGSESVGQPSDLGLSRLAFWCSRLTVGACRGDLAQVVEARLRMLEVLLGGVATSRRGRYAGLRKLDAYLTEAEMACCNRYLRSFPASQMFADATSIVDCAARIFKPAEGRVVDLMHAMLREAGSSYDLIGLEA